MAAPSTQIDTASLAELVPAERISEWVDGYNYAMRVALAIVATIPGVGSIPQRSARWDQLTPTAGTKAEGDNFAQLEMTTSEESATPGIVGFETALTDEVVAGVRGVRELHLIEAINSLSDRMDADILAASTGATNTVGTTTRVYNREAFSADAAAYRALNIAGAEFMDHAFCGHGDAFRDLDLDEVLTAAAKAGSDGFRVFSATAGYMGPYGGFQMFQSNNVAAESPGWSNFMTPIGLGRSGLMAVITEGPSVEENRGRDGALAASTYYVFRAWYAAGMRNRTRLLECLSRT